MTTKADVYSAVFNWLQQESGLTVIRANQRGPRPPRPYASLNFLNPSSRLGGSVDVQSMTAVTNPDASVSHLVTTSGMRKAIASINVFGDNAVDRLAQIRDSLDRPDVVDLFAAYGAAHLEESQINDLTALLETEYEERGQIDITFSFAVNSDVDVSTIETVDITGLVDEKTVRVNT